jgi:hypothetical protein
MPSLTEQILAKVVTLLDADGKPEGVSVNRERVNPASRAELPMISVYQMREDVTRVGGSRTSPGTDRDLHLQVRCRATGDSSSTDPLRVWTVATLSGLPGLGGLSLDVEELSTEWEHEDATDGGYDVAVMTFKVRFATKVADLTAKL